MLRMLSAYAKSKTVPQFPSSDNVRPHFTVETEDNFAADHGESITGLNSARCSVGPTSRTLSRKLQLSRRKEMRKGLVGHVDCVGRFVLDLSECYCEDREKVDLALKKCKKLQLGYETAISMRADCTAMNVEIVTEISMLEKSRIMFQGNDDCESEREEVERVLRLSELSETKTPLSPKSACAYNLPAYPIIISL